MKREQSAQNSITSLNEIKVDFGQFITINNKINRLQAIIRGRNVLNRL